MNFYFTDCILEPTLRDMWKKKNITEIFKKFKQKICYKMDSTAFVNSLKFIRQKNYESSIVEFYNEIKMNLDKYSTIKNLTEEEYYRTIK